MARLEALERVSSSLEWIVRSEWGAQGWCRSCGWHSNVEEHDLSHLELKDGRIELPCLADDGDDHRGVRIYVENTEGKVPPAENA